MLFTERGVNMGDEYTFGQDAPAITITLPEEEQYDFNFDNFTVSNNYTPPPTDWHVNDINSDILNRLDAIESRLSILKPDPEKLEKWEALREAYEHYKSLETLIGNGDLEDDN
jgi:hypothetical protein